MNFNIFNSIILAGIIQGLIFGIVVASSKKYRAQSTVVLVWPIVVFSLSNLQYYLQDTGIITSGQLFGYVWLPWQLLSGALLLCYGIKLLYPEKPLSRRSKFAFVPFVAGLAVLVVYRLLLFIGQNNEALSGAFKVYLAIVEFFSILFDQIIVIWLLVEVRNVQRSFAKQFDVTTVRPGLGWFFNLLLTFFVASFLWLYVGIETILAGATEKLWYIVWIFMSGMIYWLGHKGIYKFGVFEERKKIRTYMLDHARAPVFEKPRNEHILAFEQLIINQKRFLNPDLTLDKTADELGISKSHLSRMINSELKTSFPDYINALRIEEAKTYLLHLDFSSYTLVAIGLEAGFASKTTFNSTFKKVTGFTPSEFRTQNETAVVQQLEKPIA